MILGEFSMEKLAQLIRKAQDALDQRLSALLGQNGLEKSMYVRYLSMQYHLTMGVQAHFYRIAGHESLINRKSLRGFLTHFADEEAPHYAIAEKDLKTLGYDPLPICLDVELWQAYFASVIDTNPFIRLGATCVLENISSKSAPLIAELIRRSDYLEPKNLRFLTIHMHNTDLPHGEQILSALANVALDKLEVEDLCRGAFVGQTLFLRMIDWALREETYREVA
jgi:hypothetical protein